MRDDDEARQIEELRAVLRDARREGRAFCASGARHSMGGQSLPRDGVAATMAAPSCVLDAGAQLSRAPGRAGAMSSARSIRRVFGCGDAVEP
jgi:hypothetical protein